MASTDNKAQTAAPVKITKESDTEFHVSEFEDTNLPLPVDSGARDDFDQSIGPVHVQGYIVEATDEIGVKISILGIQTGTFYGNVREGVTVTINLVLAKGTVKFYRKDGKNVNVKVDLEGAGGGISVHEDVKLATSSG
ncbi:hypothetical protein K461DRAFT_296167 [Myriangium duriaei CBS 260.36]|uniref:Uncharacterized protein n=1 Tax=Myriangium duriaei CBS 260.36 TaxID=1168546 RepID=A0A9P4IXW4_9PEZI|nr:hypothetical protein K461DRAFT_296167 [Myriangium duriaei CBS 260.36]